MHWSRTHMSRTFLADVRKRLWRGDVRPAGTGLAGTGLPDQESRLDRESREEWRELKDKALASSSIYSRQRRWNLMLSIKGSASPYRYEGVMVKHKMLHWYWHDSGGWWSTQGRGWWTAARLWYPGCLCSPVWPTPNNSGKSAKHATTVHTFYGTAAVFKPVNVHFLTWEILVPSRCRPSAGKRHDPFVSSAKTMENGTSCEILHSRCSSPEWEKLDTRTHHDLAAHHLQQVEQLRPISEIREQVWHEWGRASLQQCTNGVLLIWSARCNKVNKRVSSCKNSETQVWLSIDG